MHSLNALAAKGKLKGAYEFSWKFAGEKVFNSITNKMGDVFKQQAINQIMKQAVNPTFERVFL